MTAEHRPRSDIPPPPRVQTPHHTTPCLHHREPNGGDLANTFQQPSLHFEREAQNSSLSHYTQHEGPGVKVYIILQVLTETVHVYLSEPWLSG